MTSRFSFLWFFLILVLLTGFAVVTPYLYNRSQLLRPDALENARRLWEQTGPADYDLTWREKVQESGEETLTLYEVQVRAGKLVGLKLDGQPVEVERLSPGRRDFFTVPGMMKQIESELDEERSGDRRPNYLNAYFDLKTGCPFRYVRRIREKKYRLEWIVKLNPPTSK